MSVSEVKPAGQGGAGQPTNSSASAADALSEEEQLMAWQDALDEVAAGRSASAVCPFCSATGLAVVPKGQWTRVGCRKCAKFIEGRIGSNE